jgi:DNA primase
MDAIAYYRAGFPNVVATMGVTLSDEHINLIKSIPTLQTVILSFDNDEAGTNANITNGKKLLEEKIDTYVVGSYDKAIKDVDELLNTKGKEAISEIIDTRRDYISFLIDQNFSVAKPNDEKIHLIKKVLAEMIELDDIMLKTLHLEFLSKYTGISLQDLSAQYDMLLKNKYASLGYEETIKSTPVIKKQTSVAPVTTKDSAIVEQYKYKFNVVCHNISNLLQEIIRSCFINHKVIAICDEHLYTGELKKTFKIECLILKALICFNKEDISIPEVKQYIFSNYPEERTMLDYFFENLEANSLMPLSKDQALISALSIINNINERKYEFENLQLSILLSKEEEKGADKDENLIIELSNKIRVNNVAKKNKH